MLNAAYLGVVRRRTMIKIAALSPILSVFGCGEKQIGVGTKLKLWGGYDMEPRWLMGRDCHTGAVERLIPGQNEAPALVVRLDSPITVDGVTGELIVLELRYVGAKWVGEGVAHVELCDFEPEEKTWSERHQGAWVESHASFKPI
jgi:hypothetical protein